MGVLGWVALIWFGAPGTLAVGVVAALMARSRQQFAVAFVAVVPWALMVAPLFHESRAWLVVLLTAWSIGCMVPLATRRC